MSPESKYDSYFAEYVKLGRDRSMIKLRQKLLELDGKAPSYATLYKASRVGRWEEKLMREQKEKVAEAIKDVVENEKASLSLIKEGVEVLLLKLVRKANSAIDSGDIQSCSSILKEIEQFCGKGNVMDTLLRGYQVTQPKTPEIQITNNTLKLEWEDDPIPVIDIQPDTEQPKLTAEACNELVDKSQLGLQEGSAS